MAVGLPWVELVPGRRVVFTYGWEEGLMGLPPGATTVEIDLTEDDGVTTLRLAHRGIPADLLDAHRYGWEYFLGRLGELLAGTDGR